MCLLNGHDLRPTDVDEGEAFVLAVAAGGLEVPEIAHWIRTHMTPV
ncbi:MAG: hypothetical protein Q4G67_07335 [Actinomycetia bacterium]|nr:hypothetical protein [Actinomycetes bacterium]